MGKSTFSGKRISMAKRMRLVRYGKASKLNIRKETCDGPSSSKYINTGEETLNVKGMLNIEHIRTYPAKKRQLSSITISASPMNTNMTTHIRTKTIADSLADQSVEMVPNVRELCKNASLSNETCVLFEQNNVTDNDVLISNSSLDICTDSYMIEPTTDKLTDENGHDNIEDVDLYVDKNIDARRLRSAEINKRCIINFGHIFAELQRLSKHWIADCDLTDLVVTKTLRLGLKTQFFIECQMCHFKSNFWSEPTCNDKLDINRGAVYGTIVTRTGHKHLEELLTAMDIPCMSNKTYIKYRNEMAGIGRQELLLPLRKKKCE